ncbi:SoxR reducing system RseC family protein [Oceanospirillum sp.]|uniref:SoxR reducing system RseC family protein n=1 Tax=Oceanospirillum sp. TaxID=2021254 RepID=UPI003A91FC09
MLEEQAIVVDVSVGEVWVETCRQTACQSCSAKSSCGHSLLSKISSGKTQRLQVQTNQKFQVGDQVILGLGEGAFIRGSALVYLLPLLTLMAGALIGEQFFGQDSAMSFALSGAGLLFGFVYVRWYSLRHRQDSQYQPVVLRKQSSAGDIPLVNH